MSSAAQICLRLCSLCWSCVNSPLSLHFLLTSSVPPSVGHCSAHPPFSPILSTCSTHTLTFQYNCISPDSPSSCHTHLSLPWALEFTASRQTDCVGHGAEPTLPSDTCCEQRALKRFNMLALVCITSMCCICGGCFPRQTTQLTHLITPLSLTDKRTQQTKMLNRLSSNVKTLINLITQRQLHDGGRDLA